MPQTPFLGALAIPPVPVTGTSIGYDPTASGSPSTNVQSELDRLETLVAASTLTIEDEGTPLATDATTLNFVGAGVTATGSGATKTITIPGGGDIQRTFAFFGG